MDPNSIIQSIKKLLGLDHSYEVFDPEILIHINTAFSTLTQLGVGPKDGFLVEEATTWGEFLEEDSRLASAKTYVYLRVRLLWDPPTTSFAIDSFKKQCDEIEWRLNVVAETKEEKING